MEVGNLHLAAEKLRRGLEIAQRQYAKYPEIVDLELTLGDVYFELGQVYKRLKKMDESGSHFEAAMRIFRKLSDAHPSLPKFRIRYAFTQGLLPSADRAAIASAIQLAEEAIRESPELVGEFQPDVDSLRELLAAGHESE
jgi:tetratricopeptide (TPR) repeat protein